MMNIRLLIGASLPILLTVGCASTQLEIHRQALLDTDRAWAAAAQAGDVTQIISYWADDATNFFPGAPVAKGTEALSKLVKRNRSQPGFSLHWEPEFARVSRSGDLGYTHGHFTLSRLDNDGKPMQRTGHYVCIWERQTSTGDWKCIVESTVFGP